MQESKSITRRSASNLALAFIMLPKEKRDGMSALYAFCREVDDVADEETAPLEERRARLEIWKADITRACSGAEPRLPVNRELQPFISRHGLRCELFHELIRGVELDLEVHRYETFADLEQYCYRVASVVGLLSIEVFGYKNPACRDYADHLGKALQMTNILRDVKTDAARGRIYLPQEELRRFGVSCDDIHQSRYNDRYRQLASAVAARAKVHYRHARQALPAEDRRSMVAAELMGTLYWQLLAKLESQRFDVFGATPTRLSKIHKLALIAQTWLRLVTGAMVPRYGTP